MLGLDYYSSPAVDGSKMNRISAPGTVTNLTLETQAAAQQEIVGTELGSEVPLFSKLPARSSGWKLISRLLSPLTKSQCQEGREARAGASREHRQVMGTEDCARSTLPEEGHLCPLALSIGKKCWESWRPRHWGKTVPNVFRKEHGNCCCRQKIWKDEEHRGYGTDPSLCLCSRRLAPLLLLFC